MKYKKPSYMKIYLRFIFIFILTFTFGAGRALAEEEVYKTLTFTQATCNENVIGYSNSWTATVGNDTWNIVNFSNGNIKSTSSTWTYIRCGRESSASTAYIVNANTFDNAITKVVVTIDAIVTKAVKNIYLNVYSDAKYKTRVDSIKATTKKTGDTTFSIPASSQSASYYYKLAFDCNKGSTQSAENGFVQVSKVTYYADTKNTTTTTFSDVTNNTLNVTQGYSYTSPTASVKAGTETLTGATVTYSSSNTDVATVDSDNGTLTITGAGTTTITAKYTGDGTYSASS